MHPLVKGSLKSKINWLGLAVIVLSYLQTNMGSIKTILAPVLAPAYTEAIMGLIGMAVGMAIIVARFFTSETLHEKGRQ